MGNETSVYEAVGAPRRRAVCQYVAASVDTEVTLEEVTTHVVTEERSDGPGSVADGEHSRRVSTELHHVHLPKLDEAAVLRYEPESHLVWSGPELPVATNSSTFGPRALHPIRRRPVYRPVGRPGSGPLLWVG